MLSFPTGIEIVLDHTSPKIDIFILTQRIAAESIDSHHIVFISKVQRSPTVSYDLSIAEDCKTVESSNENYKL